jgi:hypothetical protein
MAERDKLFAGADSRLKNYRFAVTHPTMNIERTYCFLCGRPWGWTSKEGSQLSAPAHIVVTCDACDERIVNIGSGDEFPLKKVPTWLFDAYGIIPEQKESK